MDLLKNKNSLDEGYKLHWYEIKQVIGRGGFGITYLAHDQNLERRVAIKEFMPEEFATRESNSTVNPKSGEQKKLYEWGLMRFIAEARTLAKFNHPNIVQVLSVFEANNTAYMVMEYAQGKDLSVIYKRADTFTQEQLLDTFIPILDGLSLVHNAGFIHRDIKPANIYLCDNESPLLLDFGSARQSLGDKTCAMTSLVTYGYAPYEQYNEGKGKQGPWTDIYSLGASIYYGIAGKKPMDALVRGGGFLEKGLDTYEPISILAKGDYSDNFLLAIDNALMFKLEERPENVLDWADMLLGKTTAPLLPEYMTRYAENDETVVRPWPTTGANRSDNVSTDIFRGSQGLVDASGRRNSSRNSSHNSSRSELNITSIHTQREQQALKDSLSKIDYTSMPHVEKKSNNIDLIFVLLITLTAAVFLLMGGYSKNAINFIENNIVKHIQKGTKQDQQLAKILVKAQQAFDAESFVAPEKNNAFNYYQQVLTLDAGNVAAKIGLENLERALLNRASAQYINKNYKASLGYLKQLKKVNPKSTSSKSLHDRLNSEKYKNDQINNWLAQANKYLNNNRYTSPPNKNAYEVYRKILNRQPQNKQAQRGIVKIQHYYKKIFKLHISESRLKRAEWDIKVMKNINVSLTDIKNMQKILSSKKRKIVAEKNTIKTPIMKNLTIEQASKKISRFK